MQKNLTLTIDEDVLRDARKYALDHNTSVNQLVRDHLAELVSHKRRGEELARSLDELFKSVKADVGPITWTRDDLHER